MANAVYNSFKSEIGKANVDWDDNSTTTIKVLLVTSSYAPNIDTHTVLSDISNEVVGTGYTAGGKELLNRSVAVDTANDVSKYDADDVSWATSTITARGAVIYKDTGVAGTSPLIAYIDFVSDKVSTEGNFNLLWHVDGIFKVA
jgi:hypothetical protein